jgi:hypothetical protein
MGICKYIHIYINILQRFQNKLLRAIVNVSWYVTNGLLHVNPSIPTVREEVTNISWKYKGKITTHTNELATILLNDEDEPRRLKRHKPNDLTTRFT